MKVLLYTHALLWYITSDLRLSDKAREIIQTKTNLFFSIASLWEISIKINIGKLQQSSSFDDILIRLEFINAEILSLKEEDAKTYVDLPFIPEHRDPFDRILVAQAINYSLDIVSGDKKFDLYPIGRVWE
ncbi:PIN domain-containing protein [Synechococcales cyanobacterium C]|uniref:PIN domain-containing protein n=1 Tax=Petrachloros mirabilis ULC683 TaxID=2781853 RepID=A0A8K1ZX52_9CYAN|nr:type II toxin-antitoxin system VapC family toxin [Petrachloros mirabilis]NCJ05731.1 PIN domain-containing protein [Petrachloros mirabilis ULC683]